MNLRFPLIFQIPPLLRRILMLESFGGGNLRTAPELHFCIIEVMWALLRNCALWTLLCRKMHFNGTLSQSNSQTKHLKNKILFNELDPKIEEEWHFSWPRAMQHVGCARGWWAGCKRSAWDAFSDRVVIIIMIVIIINTRPRPAYGRQGLAGGSLRASGAQLGSGKWWFFVTHKQTNTSS